ncbi:MAG: Methylase involved in ubiquinone/menaquinone biosynthesis [Parcubacteria group bacterium GW2011_GWA2_47_16]|nr:MAG: Methylase involved in ubiquinone/menaquinone biosynthesis [Parcubacteria group bacterium GW2011_GWA2_47_16]
MKKDRHRKTGHEFWNKEYKDANHLALSENPSEDLVKFTRWLERNSGLKFLNKTASVLDLGCGNGRNLIWLAENFGARGIGYDISNEAVTLAQQLSEGLPIEYQARSIVKPLPLQDSTQTLILDMMTSHFLKADERKSLLVEITRVLKPGGWLFWKTFLLDEDLHAKRMLRENPANEAGSYIHPKIGVAEHVFTEEEATEALAPNFTIHKITKSHGHRGPLGKRRSMSIYAERNF